MPPAGEADRLVAVLRTLIARAWPGWDDARSAAAAARAAQGLLGANRRYHARLVDLLAAAHQRSGRGDVPGRRATLAALDRLTVLAGGHFAGQ
jgi:cation transport regulator ChaC